MRNATFRQMLALGLMLAATDVLAAATIIPPPPDIAASSYVLVDATTGEVLVEHNLHERLPPASLTKIMTAYVAEVELTAGRIDLDDPVLVSVKAWRTPGSRMFIQEGTQVSVDDLLRGIIIQSGNDASVALAEHVAGSEQAFADMMNQQAARLGMVNSQFRNATGLPAEDQRTTAWDLTLITRALINEFPEHYAIYAERHFTYNDIEQPNRNRLLWRDRTVDGVKTGHTEEAGYCLVASALRGNMRLISVVMGTASDEVRMRESQKLLSYGFRYFETQKLYDAGVTLKSAPLWYGEHDTVELGIAEDLSLTIPRGRYEDLQAELEVPRVIEAPLGKGDPVGHVRLLLDDETLVRVPLIALEEAPEGGLFARLWDAIRLFFTNLLSGD